MIEFKESDKALHIMTVQFSGDYNEYKKEYTEFIEKLGQFKTFVKNYMHMRNRISNYFDNKIVEKLNLYSKYVLQKSTINFDLKNEIKLLDIKYFMDAFDRNDNETLKKMSDSVKAVCVAGYNKAVETYKYEKIHTDEVIKPTYTENEIADYKQELYSYFPELAKTNSK